jgi:hypothetical protein
MAALLLLVGAAATTAAASDASCPDRRHRGRHHQSGSIPHKNGLQGQRCKQQLLSGIFVLGSTPSSSPPNVLDPNSERICCFFETGI